LAFGVCTMHTDFGAVQIFGLRDRDLGPFRVLGQHRTMDNTGLCVNTRF